MQKHSRLLALAIAVAVNSVALAAMHSAMTQFAEHERTTPSEPERIVVNGQRNSELRLASRACPPANTL